MQQRALIFHPGQYLNIALPRGNDALPLSIGSAPHRLPDLHLYYRSTPGLAQAQAFDSLLDSDNRLSLSGPHGNVCLPQPLTQPLLLITAGTGVAQAFSMLEAAYNNGASARHTLLQLAATPHEWILHTEEQQWQLQGLSLQRFADPTLGHNNQGLRWLVDNAAHFHNHWILISGTPAFVYSVLDLLIATGLNAAQTHSDVYDYAPR